MKTPNKLIFPILFLVIILSSCQAIYYKKSLYVPVKISELKRDYSQIKEIDSFATIKRFRLKSNELKDTMLKRNRIIVDKVNEVNKIENKVKEPYESKLYTLDEIKKGKLVRTYYKRDLNRNLVAYKKKNISTLELVLYILGITALSFAAYFLLLFATSILIYLFILLVIL